MKVVRVRGFVDFPRSIERVVDLFVITLGHALACGLAGDPWNAASQSATAFSIVVFLLLAEMAGLYGRRPSSSSSAQGRLAVRVWAATLPLLVLFQVFGSATWHSLVSAIWAVLAGAGMLGWRLGLRRLAAAVKLGQGRTVGILGATKAAERLCADIRQRPWLRMRVAGIFDDRSVVRMPRALAAERRGDLAQLVDACKRRQIDTVIVALPTWAEARIRSVVDALGDTTATVLLVADIPSLDLLNATWTAVGGVPLVGLGDNRVGDVAMSLKRFLSTAMGRVSPALVSPLENVEPLLARQVDGADDFHASAAVFSAGSVGEPATVAAPVAADAPTVGPSA